MQLNHRSRRRLPWALLALAVCVTAVVYWPGLSGGWLFDDYPNIVDNLGVQPHTATLASLMRAALSSPASEFKRPLASLSFAANYLASGLDPYSWKLVNLIIHLLNGALVFVLARLLLLAASLPNPSQQIGMERGTRQQAAITAALVAAGWMLLPINLTAVLYVVQRMESMANLFVLLGLIGYVASRQRMLQDRSASCARMPSTSPPRQRESQRSFAHRLRSYGEGTWGGFWLCAASLILATVIGLLAKETAVMLPLYACLVEWLVFGFRMPAVPLPEIGAPQGAKPRARWTRFAQVDKRVAALFAMILVLPGLFGLAWLMPSVMSPATWAARDFTLGTRLLSESRIVLDYIKWTLLPTPQALSFYHDNFRISTGLLVPWTTLASLLGLLALVTLIAWQRRRRPLLSLGLALFLGCQLLTGTILPLELVYEHRNYFASFGLLLALVPLLATPMAHAMALARRVLLGGLMLLWVGLTAITASAWGNPLLLAETLAARAPNSPRALYELGRTYIVYSHYDPTSPFTKLVYAPLERAATLPDASILPEQALIFMNARMHRPIKDAWWASLIAKLKARKPGVQDESSLGALTQCVRDGGCDLSKARMVDAYLAALSHPHPSARLLAMYGDYSWNVLDDRDLGERMTAAAVKAAPNEPAYHITLARMQAALGRYDAMQKQIAALQALNIGGRLDKDIHGVRALLPSNTSQ